jgi:hypothetical protein
MALRRCRRQGRPGPVSGGARRLGTGSTGRWENGDSIMTVRGRNDSPHAVLSGGAASTGRGAGARPVERRGSELE